jgi:hypothetical protein
LKIARAFIGRNCGRWVDGSKLLVPDLAQDTHPLAEGRLRKSLAERSKRPCHANRRHCVKKSVHGGDPHVEDGLEKRILRRQAANVVMLGFVAHLFLLRAPQNRLATTESRRKVNEILPATLNPQPTTGHLPNLIVRKCGQPTPDVQELRRRARLQCVRCAAK